MSRLTSRFNRSIKGSKKIMMKVAYSFNNALARLLLGDSLDEYDVMFKRNVGKKRSK